MAQWQRTLKLHPELKHLHEYEIAPAEFAKAIAAKLRALAPFSDEDINAKRDELAEDFDDLAKDENTTMGDLDHVMDDLYDWGDTRLDSDWNGKKVCWIDSFSGDRT